MTKIIGLTGIIGSGKSEVANIFSSVVKIIDTDVISHNLSAIGTQGFKEIIAYFGPNYLNKDGALNRKKLAELIFVEKTAKKHLEAILHPLILTQTISELNNNNDKYLILVVPLLFNSIQYLNLIDRSLVVVSSYEIIIKRLINRGLAMSLAEKIIKQQINQNKLITLADDIIYNNGSMLELFKNVNQFKYFYQHKI